MGKKRINLYLDEDAMETVRDFLQSTGQTLSGWINAFLVEFAHEIKGQPSPLNKPLEDMTLKEFGEVAAYWWKRAKDAGDSEEREGVAS